MNLPFNLKFTIFDEQKNISKDQKKLRKNLIDHDLKEIIKILFDNDNNYKILDRCEPTISSFDEKKQLRLFIDTIHDEFKKFEHSLHFHQLETFDKQFFSLEELKYISNKIKNGLERFLNYEIDNPIIYIEIDEI